MSAERIGRREFARRDGCSEGLVRQAIATGRLIVGPDGKLDAAAVGTPWRMGNVGAAGAGRVQDAQSSTQSDTLAAEARRIAAAARKTPTYAESIAKKEHFLALLRELEYGTRQGSLVELDTVRRILFDEFRALRDAWQGFPAKYGALIAADLGIDADRLVAVLTGYVHMQTVQVADEAASAERLSRAVTH